MISTDQSETSIQVTWSVLINHLPSDPLSQGTAAGWVVSSLSCSDMISSLCPQILRSCNSLKDPEPHSFLFISAISIENMTKIYFPHHQMKLCQWLLKGHWCRKIDRIKTFWITIQVFWALLITKMMSKLWLKHIVICSIISQCRCFCFPITRM